MENQLLILDYQKNKLLCLDLFWYNMFLCLLHGSPRRKTRKIVTIREQFRLLPLITKFLSVNLYINTFVILEKDINFALKLI